jgi:shikimate kinase
MAMKNIVLVGLMGSGKSTVGKYLAQNTGLRLVDTDKVIEDSVGMRISDIFELKGETVFRELECEAVKQVAEKGNVIISTGGGAFENSSNRDELLKNGMVFYLKASADCLFKRIKNDNSRPLLKDGNPKSVLEELVTEREKNYNEAHHVINVEHLTAKEVADEILHKAML